MYPHERSLVEEMADEPFALIGINSDEVETAKKAVEANNLNWRSFQNSVKGKTDISEDWCIQGWPTIVVLDADMKIRYRGHDGHEASSIAKKLVRDLAAKSEGE